MYADMPLSKLATITTCLAVYLFIFVFSFGWFCTSWVGVLFFLCGAGRVAEADGRVGGRCRGMLVGLTGRVGWVVVCPVNRPTPSMYLNLHGHKRTRNHETRTQKHSIICCVRNGGLRNTAYYAVFFTAEGLLGWKDY